MVVEVFCLFPSELTSSKHGTKRQSQSMKIINEKWNAFYSFLITRIVAHNWAGVSELRLLHTCVGLAVCVYVCLYCMCVCVCMQGHVQANGVRDRQAYKEKVIELAVEGGKKWVRMWKRVKWERAMWSKWIPTTLFPWYYTAPICSCTEQHLLSVSPPLSPSHVSQTNSVHTN